MKKYLVVVSYCEEETYLFDTIEEMLKFFNVTSIENLIKLSSMWSIYTVYEICNIWSDDYENKKN